MTDKFREAFDAWISSVDERRDANGWELLTARDVHMLREGYMEAALAQQPAPLAVPDERHPVGGLDHGWKGEYNRGWNDCRAAMLAAAPAAPVAQEPVALPDGITISKDFFGAVHIKLGDFDFIQIKYDHRYTYNSHQEWVANRIVEAITAPPAAEQPDTVAVPRELLREALAWLEVNDAGYPTKELRALLAGGAE